MEKFFDESGAILKSMASILLVAYIGCNVLAEAGWVVEQKAAYWTATTVWLMLVALAVFFTIVAVVIGLVEIAYSSAIAIQAAMIVASVKRARRQTESYKWAEMVANRILPPKHAWLIRFQQRLFPRRPIWA